MPTSSQEGRAELEALLGPNTWVQAMKISRHFLPGQVPEPPTLVMILPSPDE